MEYNELIEKFAASLGLDGVEIEGGAAAFDIDGMRVNVFNDAEAGTVMVYGEIGQPPSDDDRSFGPAEYAPGRVFRHLSQTAPWLRAALQGPRRSGGAFFHGDDLRLRGLPA